MPTNPENASQRRDIRIAAIVIILDNPINGSACVKISIDGNDSVYVQYTSSALSSNAQRLRYALDPALTLPDGSGMVVRLCTPGYLWGHYVVAEAAITSAEALRLRPPPNSQAFQEVQLRYSPVIAIEIANPEEPSAGTQAETNPSHSSAETLSAPSTGTRPFRSTMYHFKPTVPQFKSWDRPSNPSNPQPSANTNQSQPGVNIDPQPGIKAHQSHPQPSANARQSHAQPSANARQSRPQPSVNTNHSHPQPNANAHQSHSQPSVNTNPQPSANTSQSRPQLSTNAHHSRPQPGTNTNPHPSAQPPSPSPTSHHHQHQHHPNQPPRPRGSTPNPTQPSNKVANARAEAAQLFDSTLRPGIGISLRKIRLEKASKVLREVEPYCTTEQLGQVKNQLLNIQCEFVDLFRQGDMCQKDVSALLAQISEALDIWVWRRAHPRLTAFDDVIFRTTLSSLPALIQQCPDPHGTTLALQSLLAKSRVSNDLSIMPLRIEVAHRALEGVFHDAIRHFEAGRWALAMSLLKSQDAALDVLVDLENTFNTARARATKHNARPPEELYEPRNAVLTRVEFEMQLAMCRGSQLLHTGDLHFKEAETGMAEDMMGHAQLAQDDYRAALSYITGQDVELEGATIARLARFYAKVVKLPVPAHQLYLRAVQLAASLSPALPRGSWYTESVAAVQAHRDKLQEKETKEWAARREPILQGLATDMEKLRKGRGMQNREFCEFVFREWPPKTEGPMGMEASQDAMDKQHLSKNQLLKVIRRYHTDKNVTYGEEWLVLCEEISKELTARYNNMKGAD